MKKSPAYPGKTLFEEDLFCVSVFDKIGDAQALRYPDLAKHGNIPVREADTFAATAGQYGWMERVHGKGYKPIANLCKALKHPREGEKQQIYLNALTTPPLYKLIISEFNGKKTTQDGLLLFLKRHGDFSFTDAGAQTAAKIFLENVRGLNLLDADSHLNIDATIVINPTPLKSKRASAEPKSAIKSKKLVTKVDDTSTHNKDIKQENRIMFDYATIPLFVRGNELKLQVLEDMNKEDWKQLIKQIENTIRYLK
mgnify:CR=1 FL=1